MSNTGDDDLKCEAGLALPTAGAGRSLEKRRYCIDAQFFYFFCSIVITWIFAGSF